MAYLGKTPSQAVRSRYYFTASGGETSLSGTDDNGNTLTFTDGNYVDVSLNGATLVAGSDYNTTTTNTIGGLAALTASDVVEVVVYDTFSVFGGNMAADLKFKDNVKAVFGTGSDLQIYHDGSHSYIDDAGTGRLYIRGNGAVELQKYTGEKILEGNADGAVNVYYNNSLKLATAATGINVTGTVTADGVNSTCAAGDGNLALQAYHPTSTSARDIAKFQSNVGGTQVDQMVIGCDGNVDINGTVTADGLTSDSITNESGNLSLSSTQSVTIKFDSNNDQTNREFNLQHDTNTNILTAYESGDISFYSSDGLSQGFYWDASTQRLGLGTTTPGGLMEVKVASGQSGATQGYRLITADGGGYALYPTSAVANPTFLHNVNSGESQAFGIGGVAQMTIDSVGNVGIGTTPDSGTPLHVAESSASLGANPTASAFLVERAGNVGMTLGTANTGLCSIFMGDTDSLTVGRVQYDNSDDSLQFWANSIERMRIDSSGNVIVGGTSADAATSTTIYSNGQIRANTSSINVAIFDRRDSDGGILEFKKDDSTVGSVSVTTSGTTYNTTSDARLKTDIEPIDHATDMLMAMNPVSHRWKADPDADAVVGFIAQEMQKIVPEAVSKGDSEDDMWSMDYGRITPVLVAALQDAHRKIEQLEQRIADMENK